MYSMSRCAWARLISKYFDQALGIGIAPLLRPVDEPDVAGIGQFLCHEGIVLENKDSKKDKKIPNPNTDEQNEHKKIFNVFV